MRDAGQKLSVPTVIQVLIIAVGLVLMIGKIVADSEPGAIPILLILVGIGWYFIQRVRLRSHQS